MSRPRYAVYLAPAPQTALWRLASAVIGRDAASGEACAFPEGAPCDAPDWAALTAEPRRYGFHATLKAPFELADGVEAAQLIAAAEAFAAGSRAFAIDDLEVALLGSFVALRPATANAALDRLAADCVVLFEPHRAPLTPAERARRVAGLTEARHVASVDRWGYPWVFEDFRFHMTLTGPLAPERREAVRAGLAAIVEPVARPLRVDALTLFVQEDRAAPFRVLRRLPFAAG
mgnify:CR=1 FL=1